MPRKAKSKKIPEIKIEDDVDEKMPDIIIKQENGIEMVVIKEEFHLDHDDDYEFEFQVDVDDYFEIVKELRTKELEDVEFIGETKKCCRKDCNKTFEKMKYLKRHERRHEVQDELKSVNTICHLCGLCVVGNFDIHLNKHERGNFHINLFQFDKKDPPRQKSWPKLTSQKGEKSKAQNKICDTCGKPFRKRRELEDHTITHTHERPFECKWCGKKLRTEKNLEYHLQRHIGVKEFVCDLCGREVSNQQLLDKHLLTHQNNYPFKCQVCGISYKHQSTLCRHSKIHEKLVQCSLCPLSFQYDSHLRKHLLQMHKNENGINLPRPIPQKVPRKKSTKKQSDCEQNSSESFVNYYAPQGAPKVIINHVMNLHPY